MWLRTSLEKSSQGMPPSSYIISGDSSYQLRDKEPADLKTAQELAEKIEKNMQSSGKSNIPGYTRGNTSYNKEKGKVVEL